MSEAGRKLTIRMPDNPRLRSVEVAQLHTETGERVLAGTPIMSLHKGRRDHIVRTPRPGRIVPLVAIGDRIEPGDPLYILHLDEQAMLEQNRAERALIAQEQAKWSDGITPDKIEPIVRSRRKARPDPWVSRFAADWGKPVLAVALYVLACFAILPILHTFGEGASTLTLVAMCTGSVLFGALIYYLYAPNAGPGPRWTVRMIAASWVGISALAIFYRPDVEQDFSIAGASSQIEAMFEVPTEPVVVPPPAEEPAVLLASGVQVAPVTEATVPDHTAPQSVLTFDGIAPDPHGVSVRSWARVNPAVASGDALDFQSADARPGIGAAGSAADTLAASSIAVLEAGQRAPQAAPELDPDTLRAAPAPQARAAAVVLATPRPDAVPSLPVAEDPRPVTLAASRPETEIETETADEALGDQRLAILPPRNPDGEWLASNGLPILLSTAGGGAVQEDPAWQGAVMSRAPATAPAALPIEAGDVPALALTLAEPRAKTAGWLHDNGLPVLLSGKAGTFDLADDAWQGKSRSIAPGRAAAPVRLAFGATPDLMLVGVLRAGEADWMDLQTARLAPPEATGDQPGASVTIGYRPVTQTEPGPAPAPGAADSPAPAHLGAAPRSASAGWLQRPARPLRLALAPSDQLVDAPAATRPDVRAERLGDVEVATAPAGVPGIPAIPTYQPATQERLLLFVYFDDPRLTSHPGIGDAWSAPVSEDLAPSVAASTVVAEKQIIQVQEWCPAASDPSRAGSEAGQTAWLNDRIRLLEVRVEIEADRVGAFEQEVPLFDGTPAGFFHNRAPVMGGLPGSPILEDGMAYLRSLAAGIVDPDDAQAMAGGQYFDSPLALATILRGAGCVRAEWNGGGPPDNAVGRALEALLAD